MVNTPPAGAEPLDLGFRALAHPVRRSIIMRLADGPRTVGEASTGAGVSKPAVSRHLRVLEDAGLITRTTSGRTTVLALRTAPLDAASAWIEHGRRLWERKLDVIAEYLAETP